MRAFLVFVSSIGLFGNAFAQETIPSEQSLGFLLSPESVFTIETGLTYSTSSTPSPTGRFTTIETGTGSFVSVPVDFGAATLDADRLIGSATLRYGLSQSTELYARTVRIQGI